MEPRRPKKYRILASFQNFIQSLVLEEAEKDYYQIDKIVNSLVWTLRNSPPSETIVEELLERLVVDTNQNKAKISLFRLGLLYKLEELLNGIALKKISTSNVTETNHASRDLIDDLRFQRDILTEEFSKLFNQNQVKQQELNKNHGDLAVLRKIISEHNSTLALLRKELENHTEINHNNQVQINELASRLKQATEELSQLKVERKHLIKNSLRKQSEINDLAEQLRKFSQERRLSGDYIGNLSNKNSKYHFNRTCRDWRSLAIEYLFMPDSSRDIRSTNSPAIFRQVGLQECDICAGRRNQT